MNVSVYNRQGADSGRQVELDEAVFGIEPNDHVIWLDVRQIQANARQGTHKTKERSEVAKSTRKLYRQKGTGGARAGDAKSPIRKGGGTIFGPRPRDYGFRVNKKTKRLARRSALSYKVQTDALRIVEDFQFDAPKTKDFAQILADHGFAGQKVLLLTNGRQEALYRSARNIQKVDVRDAADASTLDLVGAQVVLVQEGALAGLTESLQPKAKAVAGYVADDQGIPPTTTSKAGQASDVHGTPAPAQADASATTAD